MIYRDLYCPKCDLIKKDVIFASLDEVVREHCPKCNIVMKNYCACGSFELKYNNKKDICGWGADNYNTSQYYRDSKG